MSENKIHKLQQAKAYLQNPKLNPKTQTTGILKSLSVMYEQTSPEGCLQAMEAANTKLRTMQVFVAVMDLCKCPYRFSNTVEVEYWKSRIKLSELKFSAKMYTDALLILVQISGWLHDWKAMENDASWAIKSMPNYPPGIYWNIRSNLHSGKFNLDKAVAGIPMLADNPGYKRLKNLVEFLHNPNLDSIWKMCGLLQEKLAMDKRTSVIDGGPDDLEWRLIKIMIHRTIVKMNPTTHDEVQKSAQIAELLSKMTAQCSWADVYIAHKEILIDANYLSATNRLRAEHVMDLPRAKELGQVARILGGMPSEEDCKVNGALADLATSMYKVFRQPENASDHALLKRLKQARTHNVISEFPFLGVAADVLHYFLSCNEAETNEQEYECELPPQTPTWIIWLYFRTRRLQNKSYVEDPRLESSRKHLVLSWTVEQAWILYGLSGLPIPKSITEDKGFLDAALEDSVPENKAPLIIIRRTRFEGFEGLTSDLGLSGFPSEIGGLGDLGEAVWKEDLAIEAAYINARRRLRRYDNKPMSPKIAARLLRALLKKLTTMSMISCIWWRPVISYWFGVSLARIDPDYARKVLEGLINGPKSDEAKVQLALLLIKKGESEQAEKIITSIPYTFPAQLYVKALLHAKQGKVDAAYQQLESFSVKFASTGSPYVIAVERLKVALAERQGDIKLACSLSNMILKENANDHIVLLRLRRMLLKPHYQKILKDKKFSAHKLSALESTEKDYSGFVWGQAYHNLYRLLVSPIEHYSELRKDIIESCTTENALPLLQVMAHRLLLEKQANMACQTIKLTDGFPKNSPFLRTHLILEAWALLKCIGLSYQIPTQGALEAEIQRLRTKSHDEADFKLRLTARSNLEKASLQTKICKETFRDIPACMKKIEKYQLKQKDEELQRWCILLEHALTLQRNEELLPETWSELKPWPMAVLPYLWSADAQKQNKAVTELISVIESNQSGWDNTQLILMQCIAFLAKGNEEEFLKCFEALMPKLGLVPVKAVDLWLAAANIWFQRKDWSQFIQAKWPEKFPDRAHPEVRFVTGLAYAQAAADVSAKNPEKAMELLRLARNMLGQC